MRRLSPDEALAWRRVAASVRGAVLPPSDVPISGSVRPEPVERGVVARTVLRQAQDYRIIEARRNTLDGTWDKTIATGRVAPDRTIDLHGLDLRGAYTLLDGGIEAALRDGCRVILLITGKPPRAGTSRIDLPRRGIIRDSVGDWLAVSRHAASIAAVRNAHPRHGGAGALYIILRRALAPKF